MQAKVTAVRSVDIGVTDLSTALKFFCEVWHLEPAAEEGSVNYLRSTGAHFYVASLRNSPHTGMIRIVLEAESRASTDALYEQVIAYGQVTDGPPRRLSWPGGGYGFGFKDPEQRNFAIVSEVADYSSLEPKPDRPTRLSHVNLNCGDNDATFKFLQQALGFQLSDHANNFRFLRCGRDHHSLVIGFNEAATLNHVAFEMPDLESVMRGIGRMRDHGYPIEWGPGRHGPGNNVFAYFCGPEEFPLEYTSEMQQVDDTYRAGKPEDWKWATRAG